jgi:glycosyltransferase involved in cell wall biosynthesis
MVVLQLGPYPPPHGGVQTNLVAIRDHLRRHAIGAPVINLTRHRTGEADDVYYPRTGLQVLKLLVTVPADVVHLHIGGRLTPRLLLLSLICSLIPGRRAVLTFHSGGYPASEQGRRVRPFSLRGLVLRRLDAIIAVNAELAALFRRLGVAASRIHVMCPYAPVVLRTDVPLPEPIERFRRAHAPLLTTVGLLEPEYDLPLQIRSLATVRQSFPRAGLVIIGSGSLEPELRRMIAAEPAGRHVLLCGDVPHADTVRIIASSDLFLRTTLYDGDSVSVREALQLGVPVIATDNTMRPPSVHLIPGSDSEVLIRAIDQMLSGDSPRASREAVASEALDEVLELYRKLTSSEAHAREARHHTVIGCQTRKLR